MATEHFCDEEMTCKCGCGMMPPVDFQAKIEELRVAAGFAFPISSWCRCPTRNMQCSSTGEDGPHTTGRAVDVALNRKPAFELLRMAVKRGFTGVGVKGHGEGRFVHIDDLPDAPGQPRPTLWSYP